MYDKVIEREEKNQPGTMTISFFRVLTRRSLRSSPPSTPSTKSPAAETNEKTIRAIASALFALVFSFLFIS